MVNHEIPCVCSTFDGLLIAMNPGQSGTKNLLSYQIYFQIVWVRNGRHAKVGILCVLAAFSAVSSVISATITSELD